jgi:hypothetical protein
MQTAVWSRARAAQVRCEASGVLVPKDKAVKRFVVRPRFAHVCAHSQRGASLLLFILPAVSGARARARQIRASSLTTSTAACPAAGTAACTSCT